MAHAGFHAIVAWITSHSAETWASVATCVSAAATCLNLLTVAALGIYTVKATRSAAGSLQEATQQTALAKAQYELANREQRNRSEAAFIKASYDFQGTLVRVRDLRRAIRDSQVFPDETLMGAAWETMVVSMVELIPAAKRNFIELGSELWIADRRLATLTNGGLGHEHAKQAADELKVCIEVAWNLFSKISDQIDGMSQWSYPTVPWEEHMK